MLVDAWAQGLVLKLLEATHVQWLYGNVQVHYTVSDIKATERKEEIQKYIEEQMEIGEQGLEGRDHFYWRSTWATCSCLLERTSTTGCFRLRHPEELMY